MEANELPWLERPLQEALRQGRGHALLIHGPRGVGQFELARAVAAAWLCEGQPRDSEPAPACGRCAGCRLVASDTHPDLRLLIPDSLRAQWASTADEEPAGEEPPRDKRKPSKDIRIEAVRDAIAFVQQTSSRGGVKVVVLFPAERMNTASASALLKTLEEPPGAARLILASAAPQRLMPTIRSRCQSLRLALPDPALAAGWLAAQPGGADEPIVLLGAAGGQPIDARDRLDQGIDAAAWRNLPGDVIAGRAAQLSAWPLPMAVDALQKLCHDALCVSVGAAPRYFPAEVVPSGGDPDRLSACGRELLDAARSAEHPWNTALAAEALVQRMQRALQRTDRGSRPRGGGVPLATLDS